MQEADGLARFGEVVAARRARLGLTRFEVRDAGGPSDTTLGNIENATLGRAPSPATLRKLDRGLRWVAGSAADVLAGGEPIPAETRSGSRSRPAATYSSGPESIELPLNEINNLFALHRELNAARASCQGSDSPVPILDHVTNGFNAFVSRVAGRYATAVLERNGGPGATVPLVVEMAFAQFLDEPAAGDDPTEHEERLYRRWLAGRLGEADPELVARFEERWVERE